MFFHPSSIQDPPVNAVIDFVVDRLGQPEYTHRCYSLPVIGTDLRGQARRCTQKTRTLVPPKVQKFDRSVVGLSHWWRKYRAVVHD